MLECPRCHKPTLELFTLNYPEGTVMIVACKNCGFQGRQSPEEIRNIKPAKPKTEEKQPEAKPEPEPKKLKIRFGEDVKLREQAKDCNFLGRCCISVENEPMCLGFKFENDKFQGFDIKPCKKEKGEKK